jgi:hypothetical protein
MFIIKTSNLNFKQGTVWGSTEHHCEVIKSCSKECFVFLPFLNVISLLIAFMVLLSCGKIIFMIVRDGNYG